VALALEACSSSEPSASTLKHNFLLTWNRVNECKGDVSTAIVEKGLVRRLVYCKSPFIKERRRAGQSLSEDTETCIHGPYRKLGR
jgi:hypothetical protein